MEVSPKTLLFPMGIILVEKVYLVWDLVSLSLARAPPFEATRDRGNTITI